MPIQKRNILTYKQKRAISFLREKGAVFVPEVGAKYCMYWLPRATSPIEATTLDELEELALVQLYITNDERRLMVLTEPGKTIGLHEPYVRGE